MPTTFLGTQSVHFDEHERRLLLMYLRRAQRRHERDVVKVKARYGDGLRPYVAESIERKRLRIAACIEAIEWMERKGGPVPGVPLDKYKLMSGHRLPGSPNQ